MDYNSFLVPQLKLNFKSIKSKKANIKKKVLGNISKNKYSNSFIDKNVRNKSQINQKFYKTSFNSRKNSLNNSKTNSGSSSSNNKHNKSYIEQTNYMNKSMNIKKNIKNNNFLNNEDNFDIDKITIKDQEVWHFPRNLSKLLNKSNDNYISNQKKIKYLKTENNQKLIFNNVGIHYHRTKNNKGIDLEKKESYNNQEINKLQNTIFILLKKNSILENEKAERDNKIEMLEDKIDKLVNFIKEKKISNEDNEDLKLQNKINSLENSVDYLKSENEELKKEIEKQNKIIFSLTNSQNNKNKYHNKSKSIGKKKEKINENEKCNKKENINNKVKNLNNINENDIKKIKLISIDPDSF